MNVEVGYDTCIFVAHTSLSLMPNDRAKTDCELLRLSLAKISCSKDMDLSNFLPQSGLDNFFWMRRVGVQNLSLTG
jgi:hypothetical protein